MAYQQQQNQAGALHNAITSGSKIVGTIMADNDIRVDGIVDGDIQCNGKVVIGEKGYVKGNIVCASVEILGKVDGKIDAKQTLALRATAHIQGDVITQSLIVEPNAVFNGTCQMGKPAVNTTDKH